MIPGTLATLSTVFRRRFLFNALLPTTVFAGVLALVVIQNVGSMRIVGAWWGRLDAISKAVTLLTVSAIVWFLAVAVASQWRTIVQIFEGYPLIRLFGRNAPGIDWHRKRRWELWEGENDDHERAFHRYTLIEDASEEAEEGEVLPTTLGNILLAGERYALSRYEMDTIQFWPRLFPLLPAEFRAEYEEFIVEYEFPLVVSFLSATTGFIGAAVTLLCGGPPLLFAVCFIGGALIAYLFYVLSFSAAEELAEQQRTAFDLYRHLLLEQWPTPPDVRDERAAFKEITGFIVNNSPPSWGRPQSLHRRRRRRDHGE
ncbi:hypothetical protein [Paractinoplanes toevensis]|uniref:Uncharacterized protein n=1 Tax=Paractinoplanes toevensis TaxID=571911 RepID=A0A919WBP2_9ACTN|nr:hypothetical protein [Actinoplanes toevensis]GIM97133.1 hypothetical protein Ato02nite_089260 [Actinoplanes toevensis]